MKTKQVVSKDLKPEYTRYRQLLETIQDGVFFIDGDSGVITDVNNCLVEMLGYPKEELLGHSFLDINAIKGVKGTWEALHELKPPIRKKWQDVSLKTKKGLIINVELSCETYSVDDNIIIQGTLHDITDRKQAQQLQDAVYHIAIATETTRSLNDLYQKIHQIISSVMPAENFYITIYDEHRNLLHFPYFKDAADEPFLGEIEPGLGLTAYVLKTGKSLLCTQEVHDELEKRGAVKLLGVPSAIWLGVPLLIESKTIGAMVVQHYTDPNAYGEREQHMLEFVSTQVAIAISRKQVEDSLHQSEQRLQHAERVAHLGSWEMDITTRKCVWSAEFFRVCGYVPNAFEPNIENWYALFHPDDRDKMVQTLSQAIAEKGSFSMECRIVRRDGAVIWVDSKGEFVLDEYNKPTKIIGTFLDITSRKQAEMELRYMSIHDGLTGLYNRSYFEEEMERLDRSRQFPISIVMVDVDHLKEVNDTFGHAAGDEILKRVAHILTAACRAEDVVTRIGGDEFAVILPFTGVAAGESTLSRIRKILKEDNQTHKKTQLQLSLGVATAEKRTSLVNILKLADEKMYLDKQHNNTPVKEI